jgi:hypothetical protein
MKRVEVLAGDLMGDMHPGRQRAMCRSLAALSGLDLAETERLFQAGRRVQESVNLAQRCWKEARGMRTGCHEEPVALVRTAQAEPKPRPQADALSDDDLPF